MLKTQKVALLLSLGLASALAIFAFVGIAGINEKPVDNKQHSDTSQVSNSQQNLTEHKVSTDDIDMADEGTLYGAGEIMVGLRDGVSADDLVERYDFISGVANTIISKQQSSTFVFKLVEGTSVKRAAELLKDDSDIKLLQPNYIYYLAENETCLTGDDFDDVDTVSNIETQATTTINDELYGKGYQWSLTDSNANMFDTWDYVKNDHTNTVAVIDTGIDTDYPDLVNNIVEASSAVSEEYDPDNYFSAEDFDDHGTHVAGIIAAEANNGIGVAGISYNANIMSVHAFYEGFTQSGNWATMAKSSDIAAAIRHVVEMADEYNVKVINMSLGTANTSSDKPPADDYIMLGAIDEAYDANIYCVVAAGNDKTNTNLTPVTFPAYYDKVISVGAINGAHNWQTWSNGGKELDVVAPGYFIYSTVRMFHDDYPDDGYAKMDGTSMASPYVAATASLCYAKNPNLTFDQLYDCLTKTAVDLGDPGFDYYYGYGQVIPLNAAKYADKLNSGEPEPDPGEDENLKLIGLHIGGNDKDCFNILVAGDGYTSSEQDKFISDAQLRVDNMFKKEPYKMFKDSINVYAVKCTSNESGFNKDTFFGLGSSGGRTINFRDNNYYQKAKDFKDSLEKQLTNTKGWGTVHIITNDTGYYGASQNAMFSFSSLSYDGTDGSVMAHEMAHSIGRLGDEYDKIPNYYNVDKSSKTADDIKWKEFLGFKGVGIAPGNASDGSVVIPSPYCLMKELAYPMCEVCKAQMAWHLNDQMYRDNRDEYYVTDLDLTIEHSITGTFRDTYPNYQINNQTIKKANGHTLELRGIFQNMRLNKSVDGDNPFNLKLSLVIKNAEGKVRVEKKQEFTVDNCTYNVDKARKSLSVSVDIGEHQLYSGYTIEGTLVDMDSGKVLATFDGGEPGVVEPEPDICDHEHTELRNVRASTCTIPGYTGDKYCKDCGELLEKGNSLPLDPNNHEHLVDVPALDPTCQTPGYTAHQKCTDCGTEIGKTVLPTVDHKFDDTGHCIWCGKEKDPDPAPSKPEVKQPVVSGDTRGRYSMTCNGVPVTAGQKLEAGSTINFTTYHVAPNYQTGNTIVILKDCSINGVSVMNIDNYRIDTIHGDIRPDRESGRIWANLVNDREVFSYRIPGNSASDINISFEFVEAQVVWRIFNPVTKEHVFTPSREEYEFNRADGWRTDVNWYGEGIGWISPMTGQPVYRLYNESYDRQGYCSHFLTANRAEAEDPKNVEAGWRYDYEGTPVFYSGGDVTIYHARNDTQNLSRLYTSDFNEYWYLGHNSDPAYYGWDLEVDRNLVRDQYGNYVGIFKALK